MKDIKKVAIFLLLIFLLTACHSKEAESSRLVCESERNFIYNGETHSEDFEKKWLQKTTNYAINNYIVSFENKAEFFVTPSAKVYLEEELGGNKEALLSDYLASYMFNNFQSVDKEMIDKVEYLEDRIVVLLSGKTPQRPKGWRGLVVPDQYKLSNLANYLKEYEDKCEIIKD